MKFTSKFASSPCSSNAPSHSNFIYGRKSTPTPQKKKTKKKRGDKKKYKKAIYTAQIPHGIGPRN
jgi:hypothetical protein